MLASQPSGASHERIGRYEVLRKIATGGMAELFLAKQVGMEGFERVVAIKRILAHLAYDQEFINMFRDEARIVAKLSHPNIVQIYDLGKSEDTYFIAMEYIPGRNMSSVAKKARARGEKLPPAYIARCVAQACEGLHYAHTRSDMTGKPLKIVHRDVSPQNIIVAFSGTVKLVDFGIAKAATKIAHTRAGVLKGKYAYMSPEQIRGEEVDARSDLFAAGIVLYELLCGRRPFEKDNSIQTLKSIVQEQHRDCRELNPDIPDELAGIIDRALTKDRNKRFQHAQELQIALEDFVSGTPERVNNLTVSNWITELFKEELSQELGGTVVFQGIGEVILPDVMEGLSDDPKSFSVDEVEVPDLDEVEAAEPAPGQSSHDEMERPLALTRGRGGGSVDVRPPIQAPSNALAESSGPDSLHEEGVIDRPLDSHDGYDDDATVMGIEAAKAPYSDDKTEFAPPHAAPAEVRPGSEVHTLVPDPPAAPVASTLSRSDSYADLLQPLSGVAEDDDFDQTDDPWDEATVGYPEGAPPEDFPAAAVLARDEHVQLAVDDSLPNEDWGELSADDFDADATLAGLPEAWDDPTAARGSGLRSDSSLEPRVQSPLDYDDAEPLAIELDDPDDGLQGLEDSLHPGADDSGGFGGFGPDATIAVPSISDEMIERHASQYGRYDDGATRAASSVHTEEVSDADVEPLDFDDMSDAGAEEATDWGGDATLAANSMMPGVVGLDPDDDIDFDLADDDPNPVPGFDVEVDYTVRAMDEEPALPVPKSDRDIDLDARTVAGTTSDYLVAGVRPPVGADYDESDQGPAPEPEDYSIPNPASRRGQEQLGAIRLNRVAVDRGFGSEEHTEGQASAYDDDHGELPGVSEHLPISLSFDDDAPPVQPSPLEEPAGASEPELPAALPGPSAASARDEYSALLAPKLPTPMNSYQGDVPAGPMAIGSTNVPPANLSLSQMLEHPSRTSRSRLMAIPRGGSVSTAQGRSASVLGRQIREVAAQNGVPVRPVNSGIMPPPVSFNPAPQVGPPGLELPPPPAASAGSGSRGRKLVIAGLITVILGLFAVLAYVSYPLFFGPNEPVLTIKTTPEKAQVYVNDTLQDQPTPINISGLKPGVTYTVRLVLPGYHSVTQPVRLPENRTLIWRIPLKPMAAGAAPGVAPSPSSP